VAEFCGNQQGKRQKIKDTLKEEKRKVAEEANIYCKKNWKVLVHTYEPAKYGRTCYFYKLNSSLDFLYEIAIKKIDLKELKEFTVHGDKIFPPKPVKPVAEEKQKRTYS
jgi:guanosine-3',5'-bis(diphosphate) 3'-pyrophosphohydrolase